MFLLISDTTLVITDKIKLRPSVRDGIEEIADHCDVVFWLDGDHDVTEEQIPFFMNDISHLIW